MADARASQKKVCKVKDTLPSEQCLPVEVTPDRLPTARLFPALSFPIAAALFRHVRGEKKRKEESGYRGKMKK